MITVDLNQLDLVEFIGKENPGKRCKAAFPILGANGAESSAAVYFELEPNEELGTHTDSAEETLLVLEGTVEASVGDEKARASERQLVLVPEMVPHNVKNIGDRKAKVLGFFGGANNIVATFEHTWWPPESNVVDTSAA